MLNPLRPPPAVLFRIGFVSLICAVSLAVTVGATGYVRLIPATSCSVGIAVCSYMIGAMSSILSLLEEEKRMAWWSGHRAAAHVVEECQFCRRSPRDRTTVSLQAPLCSGDPIPDRSRGTGDSSL